MTKVIGHNASRVDVWTLPEAWWKSLYDEMNLARKLIRTLPLIGNSCLLTQLSSWTKRTVGCKFIWTRGGKKLPRWILGIFHETRLGVSAPKAASVNCRPMGVRWDFESSFGELMMCIFRVGCICKKRVWAQWPMEVVPRPDCDKNEFWKSRVIHKNDY